jgi:arginyl-tRNA synthetase
MIFTMIAQLTEYLRRIAPSEWSLEKTTDPKFGDFASNLAFRLSRERRMPPMAVAEELARAIGAADKEKRFTRVEAAPPGFINFWLSPRAFAAEVESILDPHFNTPSQREGGKKINLEFVSANPTGPLTMANGRGGFWGDVLARVLEFAGHDVTREYYINDAGVQIKRLGQSILAALGLVKKSKEHYQGDYVNELAKGLKARVKALEPEEVGRLAAKVLLTRIKKSLRSVGIKHDVWFSEYNQLRKKGELQKALDFLKEGGMVYEKDGALWLRTKKEPDKQKTVETEAQRDDDKDRVLVKSDGEATYFLADLAYHYDKFLVRGFDRAIVIWGADHHGYVGRMKSGIAALGVDPERFEAIIVQLIRLVKAGKEVKMSKRKGEFITLDDLVKDAGVDAARFFFLLHTPGNHMDFDLALAKERSNKNPVYYVQYAYVRAKGIIKKTQKQKNTETKNLNEFDFETEPELILLKELARFGDVVLETAKDLGISRLPRYAEELARAFHNFYEKERIIGAEIREFERRLSLVLSTAGIFEKLFDLLGISKPKKM